LSQQGGQWDASRPIKKGVVVMVLAASASAQTSDSGYALGFQSSWPVWGVSVMKPVREDIAETTIVTRRIRARRL
jgi:hypothetical protein